MALSSCYNYDAIPLQALSARKWTRNAINDSSLDIQHSALLKRKECKGSHLSKLRIKI